MVIEKMVEKFQCPGCVCGSDTSCGTYNYDKTYLMCTSHILGTIFTGIGHVALGFPKGFCRPGFNEDWVTKNKMSIRLFLEGDKPKWDNSNTPVWAMEKDGFLFVRTFAPRINHCWVDVIENGTLDIVPNTIDVSKFYDEID